MRLPGSAHTSRPWRIHDLTRDFRLEDVWSLPTPGGRDDFPRLVRWFASRGDPARSAGSAAARALYMAAIRPFRHLIVYPAATRDIARAWHMPGAR